MAPDPKAKGDARKLVINEDKPVVSIIDEDGPIVDSPVAIDSEEVHPPQDVRVSHILLDPPSPPPLCINVAIVITFLLRSLAPEEPLWYDAFGAQNSLREPLLQTLRA